MYTKDELETINYFKELDKKIKEFGLTPEEYCKKENIEVLTMKEFKNKYNIEGEFIYEI